MNAIRNEIGSAARAFRNLIAGVALVACIAVAPAAQATSFSPDQSDLWWVASESGWGMQLVQRGTVIFATLFVYDASNNPIWYTATLNYVPGTVSWSGTLYLTHGPGFNTVPFNPALVTLTAVGNMTWTAGALNSGHLVYSVNGATVTKDPVRQPLALENFAGSYIGGLTQTAVGCTNPASNGSDEFFVGHIISQSGAALSVSAQAGTAVCAYNGTYSQAGQMGAAAGSYSCNNGDTGSFNFSEMQVNELSFSASFSTTSSALGCQTTGRFSGTRR